MKLSWIKRTSLLLAVAMLMTLFVFPVTSGAEEEQKAKIVFQDAELKELTFTAASKTNLKIPDAVEKAKFALINDKVPTYYSVTKVNADKTRTPLELKSDGNGNVYAELTFQNNDTETQYDILAVNSDQALISSELAMPGSDYHFYAYDGVLTISPVYFMYFGNTLVFNKIDRGTPGTIKIKYINTTYCPFKSFSYKTSKDGEYIDVSFKGYSTEEIALSSKYFAVKYELKDNYVRDSFTLYIDGAARSGNSVKDCSLEFEDITFNSNSSSDPLHEFGYILSFSTEYPGFIEKTGFEYSEQKSGDLKYKLNFDGDNVKSGEITISDLVFEKGGLYIYGTDQGVTPYTLTVKGKNTMQYLAFATVVTVICEPGASLTYDRFNYEEQGSSNPAPEFILGENTVYDKETKTFKYYTEPTATPEPTETAEPTPTTVAEPTEVAEPTTIVEPTSVAEPTATTVPAEPTAVVAGPTAATAPDQPGAATATPTVTVTATAEPTKPETVVSTPEAENTVTVKNNVYKINPDQTASLISADPKAKTLSVPAVIKVKGKKLKVTRLAAGSFKNRKVMKVTLGKNITVIEKGAFNNCKKLTTLISNKNLKTVEAGAFKKCPKFKTFKIKSGKLSVFGKSAGAKKLNVFVLKKCYKKYSKMLIKAGIKKSNIKKL